MYKNATKCNETLSKWCKNKHGASKIMDMLETYHSAYRIGMHLTSGTHRGEPSSPTYRSGKQLRGASLSLAVHQDVRRRSLTSIRSLCRRRRTLVCFTFVLASSHPNSLETLALANFLAIDGGHLKLPRAASKPRLDA
jgi:hypothetical protein